MSRMVTVFWPWPIAVAACLLTPWPSEVVALVGGMLMGALAVNWSLYWWMETE